MNTLNLRSPTHDRGTDVDREARQCGWLSVVWKQEGLEAETLLHPRQDAHTGDTDAVALLPLILGISHFIHQLRLIPNTFKNKQ